MSSGIDIFKSLRERLSRDVSHVIPFMLPCHNPLELIVGETLVLENPSPPNHIGMSQLRFHTAKPLTNQQRNQVCWVLCAKGCVCVCVCWFSTTTFCVATRAITNTPEKIPNGHKASYHRNSCLNPATCPKCSCV